MTYVGLEGEAPDILLHLSLLGEGQVRIEAKLEAMASAQQDMTEASQELREMLSAQQPVSKQVSKCSGRGMLIRTGSSTLGRGATFGDSDDSEIVQPGLVRRTSVGGGWGDSKVVAEAPNPAAGEIGVHEVFRVDESGMCDLASVTFASEESEKGLATLTERFVVNPNGNFHVSKSILSMAILLYELTLTPYILAWNMPLNTHLLVQGWASAILWSLDILLTFRTGIYSKGELNMTGKGIAKHYLKTWFAPDLMVVACDWLNVFSVVMANEDDAGEGGTGGLRIMRFTKLGRLSRIAGVMRMMKAVRIFDDVMDKHMPEEGRLFVRLLSLFATIMWVAHLVCCTWFAIGVYGPTDTGRHWIDTVSFTNDDGDVIPFLEASFEYQYTTCLHWAAGQMALGSLDQMPTNTSERLFFVLAMMVGFLFGSSLVSSLSASMVDYQMMQKDKNHKLRALRQYLLERSVDPVLSVPVQKQATERLARKDRLMEGEVEILQMLSSSLRQKLHFAVQKVFLSQHPLLRLSIYLDSKLMHRLSSEAIDYKVWHTKDDIFTKHTAAKHTYLITEGTVVYRQDALVTSGGAPTEPSVTVGTWLCEAALWCQWSHVGTAEAASTVELLTIDVEPFIQGLQSSPVVFSLACEYAKQFQRRLTAAFPPLAPWPTDLEVPFTDYCDLVISMPQELQEVIGQAALAQLPKRLGQGKLSEEVAKGTCMLVMTGEGDVFRLVSLCVLRIRRGGQVFAQVGKWKGSEVTPNCQLPGAKQFRNELNNETVSRVFKTKLPWFGDSVDMVDTTRETTEKVSPEFGVRTRYLRTICTGQLCEDHILDTKSFRMSRARSGSTIPVDTTVKDRLEAIKNEEVLAVWDSAKADKADLFAWLREKDFEYLSSPAGAAVLESWLSGVEPPEPWTCPEEELSEDPGISEVSSLSSVVVSSL